MQESVLVISGKEVRSRFYEDHIQIIINGQTIVIEKDLVSTIYTILDDYLESSIIPYTAQYLEEPVTEIKEEVIEEKKEEEKKEDA